MKKKLLGVAFIAIMMFSTTACAPTTETNNVETQTVAVEREMTVDDVVEKMGCDYFIVKEIDTWVVLEEDVYMDRPVTEINICDDVEDTLCIFIDLDENEEPHIKQW